jgi:aspartate kinase
VAEALAGVRFSGGWGAVSAVGSGITAGFDTARSLLGALAAAGIAARGLSTSSFRISALVDESRVDEAARAVHAALLEEDAA